MTASCADPRPDTTNGANATGQAKATGAGFTARGRGN
jgi:hypothetical protein